MSDEEEEKIMKKEKNSVFNAWNWAFNTLIDTEVKITDSEQLTLFWVLYRLNVNYWKPVKINAKVIAGYMNKDPRTVEKALKALVEKKILIQTAKGVNINIGKNDDDTDSTDNANDDSDTDSRPSVTSKSGSGKAQAGRTGKSASPAPEIPAVAEPPADPYSEYFNDAQSNS